MSPLAWVLLSAWVLGTWLFTWSLCVAAKRGLDPIAAQEHLFELEVAS